MAALVPAAIAWACNPQAHITLDRSSYAPGDAVVVSGSYFRGGETLTVSITGGSSTNATTNGSGAFTATLPAPSSPGAYTVYARHSSAPARASFTVESPAAAQQPQEQAAPQQGSGGGEPEGGTPGGGPQSEQRQAPELTETGIVRSRGESVSTREAPAETRRESGGSTGGGVVTGPTGSPVFAGSAPAAQTGTFGGGATAAEPPSGRERGERSARGAGQPSEQTALADVWSGYAPGRTPTLTNGVADPEDGGPGSELALGIALLALGLLALAGGVTAAELRRRRAVAGR